MQIHLTGSWSPPINHTGEYSCRTGSPRKGSGPREWTDQEERWWEELTAKTRERNVHFETEGRLGIDR